MSEINEDKKVLLENIFLDAKNSLIKLSSGLAFDIPRTKVNTKLISSSRVGTANSGDVSYTGVGFKPSSVICIYTVPGTLYFGASIVGSDKGAATIYQSAASVMRLGAGVVIYSNFTSWAQSAGVKTFDADGFTLTWTKIGSPTAGTIEMSFLCVE